MVEQAVSSKHLATRHGPRIPALTCRDVAIGRVELSAFEDPQPEQGLTPIVAMSVVQIKRGDWSGGVGRGFVDLGAGIGGELTTGSAYEEPVQGGALVGRQGA